MNKKKRIISILKEKGEASLDQLSNLLNMPKNKVKYLLETKLSDKVVKKGDLYVLKGEKHIDYVNVFIVLIFAFFILRLLYMALKTPIYPGNTDPFKYHELAVQLSVNHAWTGGIFWPPGFAFILSIVYSILGPDVITAKLFAVFLTTLSCALVYVIVNKITKNRTIALLASFLLIVDPEMNFYEINNYKENLFNFLVLLSFLITLRSYSRDKRINYLPLLVLGPIVSITSLINQWALVLAILPPIYWYTKKIELDKLINGSIVIFATVIISISPWLLFYQHYTGTSNIFPYNGYFLFYLRNNPTEYASVPFTSNYPDEVFNPMREWALQKGYDISDDVQNYIAQRDYAIQFILSHPTRFISDNMKFLFDYWLFPNVSYSQRHITNEEMHNIFLWITWVLALFGVWNMWKKGKKSFILLFSVYYLAETITYMLTCYLMRYKIQYRPFEIIFCAYGLFQLSSFVSPHYIKKGKELLKKLKGFSLFASVFMLILIVYMGIILLDVYSLRQKYSHDSFAMDVASHVESDWLTCEGCNDPVSLFVDPNKTITLKKRISTKQLANLKSFYALERMIQKYPEMVNYLSKHFINKTVSERLVFMYPRGNIYKTTQELFNDIPVPKDALSILRYNETLNVLTITNQFVCFVKEEKGYLLTWVYPEKVLFFQRKE